MSKIGYAMLCYCQLRHLKTVKANYIGVSVNEVTKRHTIRTYATVLQLPAARVVNAVMLVFTIRIPVPLLEAIKHIKTT